MMMLTFLLNALVFASAKPLPGWSAPVVCEIMILGGTDHKAPLRMFHAEARAQIAAIRAAAVAVPKPERKYFAEVARAAEAAVGKHHREFEKQSDLRFMDLPHHVAILKAIAAFDPARPRYSLVEIDDAVRLRHQRREYLDCEGDDD